MTFRNSRMNKAVIEKLIFGGFGLTRTSSGVIFISDVLPGETVEYVIEGKKEGIPLARPVAIVNASEMRRTPECPLFGKCGGCDWQHIDCNFQTQVKKDIFIESLNRIGKIKTIPAIQLFDSPEKNYRIRAQLKSDTQGNWGFYQKKTNKIVKIENCPLLSEPINKLLKTLNVDNKKNEIESVNVIAGDCLVASDPLLAGLTVDCVELSVGEHTFSVYGNNFFQSNRFIVEKMGKWALPMVSGDYCVDLYGGSGFFSIMLGKQFRRGTMIESVKSQVQIAQHNFKQNENSHFKAICTEAERFESVIQDKPDLLIVDPPRLGLTKQVRKSITTIAPSKILYVSCNPSTQARDVDVFVNKGGYSITHAALFDCYPNTCHIETALLLEKRS